MMMVCDKAQLGAIWAFGRVCDDGVRSGDGPTSLRFSQLPTQPCTLLRRTVQKQVLKYVENIRHFLSSNLFRICLYLRAERVHCRCGFNPGASQAPELQWIGVVPCLADSPPMSFALLKSAASAAKVGHSVRPTHTFSSFLITGHRSFHNSPRRSETFAPWPAPAKAADLPPVDTQIANKNSNALSLQQPRNKAGECED
ncbi:hypothetical protein SISSUDRAFT_284093 [Sistotremastrum suecicum HHB10207 ss-3]|uniref:Uncharacterized protein n=1 Tax=Sistotremastrum suecicum HHB10207 ss-3 TaxID=1314776 RepID=A0A166GB09_9AGAM|nr:hypothetical protein SISSUDRAFT_284093 [Sistotremastrum suecicum HHB10207 ss-3]